MDNLRTLLETRQISIYFVATILALLVGIMVPQIADFQWAINPALALMLFVTFLQVPVTELKKGLSD
ncbi:MAG TPA: arsenic resistance protein, partial [Psychrobacter sp.]|nr:arsenic resistance protein [Psychrobacter sp.]